MGEILRVDSGTPEFMSQRRFQTVAAQAIDRQAAAIQQTREFMADMSVRIDKLEQVDAAEEVARTIDISELRGRVSGLQARSFLGRCRWLFLGR